MAEYNDIYSNDDNALIEGSEGKDRISVYGNHSTVQALGSADTIFVDGGRRDNGIWIEGDEENFIYAGSGNDSIYVQSRGASVYGEAGNDIIRVSSSHIYVDGGADNDLFSVHDSVSNFTITSGAGKDTIHLWSNEINSQNVLIADFSADDVLKFNTYFSENGKVGLSYTAANGNVVISDNVSIQSYTDDGDPVETKIQPTFNVTLKGISDISQISSARYYWYNMDTPIDGGTLGDLVGGGSTSTTKNTGGGSTTTTKTTTTTTTTTEETTTTSTPSASGGGDTIINNYYGDYYDNSNNNGTIINNSSVGGDVTNVTDVDNSTTIVISGNTWTYNGGNKVITNYQQGEVVELASDYQGIDLKENSFFVKSSTGQLEIQNARDKFVGYSAGGQMAAYSYVAGSSGEVDGRTYDKAEIMIGADNSDNQIYAGNAGSSLWGGNGGTDSLVGGNGYDEFFYAVGGGDDVIQNASNNDLVNLASVNLSQIAGVNVNIGEVTINFVDGGNLRVQGDSSVGYQIAEGTFQVDQSTGQWSDKN